MRRMGKMAMENLLKLMSGEESVAQVKVEAELIVRGSTGKARTNAGLSRETIRAGRRNG